ncbi:MAG TPA: twin-arginine translocase TatA/TatE family subunit [Candidatus Limnocylindrales bacterium]|nr:twin-arginine translocase TatA/TatE family subunit [Candidatus Limnocylindrales bacterium]
MPFNIGPGEIILVLALALLVLGPKKLPEVGSSLGKTIREFRRAASDIEESTSLERKPVPSTSSGATAAPQAPDQAPALQAAPSAAPGRPPAPEPAPEAAASRPTEGGTPAMPPGREA